MTPEERARIIVGRATTAYRCGNPFPLDFARFVESHISEAVKNDWDSVARDATISADQRALVDALIVAMEAATDISLDHQQRIDRVRQALTPHVKAKT